MQHKKLLSMTVMVAGMLLMTGCGENTKQRIAMLEEENQSLASELERVRNDADTMRHERDNCQANLLSSNQSVSELRGRLATTTTPSTTTTMPVERQTVRGSTLVATENELFKPGKHTLKLQGKQVLNRVASEIKARYSNQDIFVFGHSDNDPIKKSGWKDNRELSAQRSLSVVRYLQSQGIPAERLVACGWGEYKPVTSNSTTKGKKQNRRVEIMAVDPSIAQHK